MTSNSITKNKNPICEKCNIRTRKHDKRNGVQRYFCPKCKTAFVREEDKKIKYTRLSKRVLSLLFNLLENNFFNETDLEKAFEHNNYDELAIKVKFNTTYSKDYSKTKMKIKCYKPKLLICNDDKTITFIQIPPSKEEKPKRQFTIIDSFFNGESYSARRQDVSLIKSN